MKNVVLIAFNNAKRDRKTDRVDVPSPPQDPFKRRLDAEIEPNVPLYVGKAYAYFTDFEVIVGDFVVVETGGVYKVAQVVKTIGLTKNQIEAATTWLVQKVDISSYEAKQKKIALMQEIRNELHARKSLIEERLLFEQMAKTDDTVKQLLAKYDELDTTINGPKEITS